MTGRDHAVVTCVEGLERRMLFAVDVAIDGATMFQTIDGFGAMAPSYTAERASLLYGDMGASMVRIALSSRALRAPGDTQYNTPVTPVTLGPDLAENIAKFNFAASRVGNVLETVKASKSLATDGPVKVIASIWSPPHWMKGAEVNPWTGAYVDRDPVTDGTQHVWPLVNYYGNESSGGSLYDTPENLTQFARYVAAYVKGAELATGVPIYAVNLQNEPRFHEPYDSCVYNPALYVKAVKAVAAEFRANGITTKIHGPEDVGVGPTTNGWVLEQQFHFINAIRADPEAMAAVDVYSIHGYANDPALPSRSPTNWGHYWNGRGTGPGAVGIKNDGKPSWQTETSGRPNTWAGAMTTALNAQDALVHGNVSAWLYWNIEDNSTSLHNGALTAKSDPTAPKYVAAKHFAKYVRPGAVRVAATPSDPAGVYVSAYVDPSAKTLTSVLFNVGDVPQTVNLSLSNLNVANFNVDRRSDAAGLWVDGGGVTFANGVATLTLAPQSIVTLQGKTASEAKLHGTVIGTPGSWGNTANTRDKAVDG
ncbi:MAG TPA: hypothetical protein VK324_01225, partial [Tepidisphaeraceae bacterium]|nr:hypothetical protein [Tepidisphaeraceae bacterium]